MMQQKTDLGAYLDPLADKVMLVSSYLVLGFQQIIPFWLVAIVLLRDFVVSVGFLFLHVWLGRMVPAPSLLGKASTLFQMITVLYILVSTTREFQPYFFYTTASLTVLSGFQYIFARVYSAFPQRNRLTILGLMVRM